MEKGMGWRQKEGGGESPERGREGRKRGGEKERNLDSEYSAFPGWQNRRAQGGEKKKNCGKLTQSRIMAKSIKFDRSSSCFRISEIVGEMGAFSSLPYL